MGTLCVRLRVWTLVLVMAANVVGCATVSDVSLQFPSVTLVEDRVPASMKTVIGQPAIVLAKPTTGWMRVVPSPDGCFESLLGTDEVAGTFQTSVLRGDDETWMGTRTISISGEVLGFRSDDAAQNACPEGGDQKAQGQSEPLPSGRLDEPFHGILEQASCPLEDLDDRRFLAVLGQDLLLFDREAKSKELVLRCHGVPVGLTVFPARKGERARYAVLEEVPGTSIAKIVHLVDVDAKRVVATCDTRSSYGVLTTRLRNGLWILYETAQGLELYSFESKEKKTLACPKGFGRLSPDCFLDESRVVCASIESGGVDSRFVIDIVTGETKLVAATQRWTIFGCFPLAKGETIVCMLIPRALE